MLAIVLVIPSCLFLYFSVGFYLGLDSAGTADGGKARLEAVARARGEAVNGLRAIADMPANVIVEFESNGSITQLTESSLPPVLREQVQMVQRNYDQSLRRLDSGGGILVLLGSRSNLMILLIGLPLLLVGFLFLLRTKIWKCRICGYTFG